MGDPPEQQADEATTGGLCGAAGKGEGDSAAEPMVGHGALSWCALAGFGIVRVRHGCMESRMEQFLKVWRMDPDLWGYSAGERGAGPVRPGSET